MRIWVFTLLVVFGSALAGAASAESEPLRKLRFNPFAKPDFSAFTAEGEGEADSRREVRPWVPQLTATLVSGDNSVANLGGAVLRLGEQAHGYKLLAVRHFEADFERNGKTVTLSIDPPAAPEVER